MSVAEDDSSTDIIISDERTPEKITAEDIIEIFESPEKTSEPINFHNRNKFKAFYEKYSFSNSRTVKTENETPSSVPQNGVNNSIKIEPGTSYNNHSAPAAPLTVSTESTDNPKSVDSRMINGVFVEFPAKPYPAQISLMNMVIKGIKFNQNALLESPTGSGKTLALLCASLAWQKKEKERVQKLKEEDILAAHHNMYCHSPQKFPEPSRSYVAPKDEIQQPAVVKNKKSVYYDSGDVTDLFNTKNKIYSDGASTNEGQRSTIKRQELSPDSDISSTVESVTIHKRHKMSTSPAANPTLPGHVSSPVKPVLTSPVKTQPYQDTSAAPSMWDDEIFQRYHVPKIYFGTRTHKQLAQVISELKKTVYAKNLKMSILSSREHTCIRPLSGGFKSKTEMCKNLMDKRQFNSEEGKSGCNFLDSKSLLLGNNGPSEVWDIEDLVTLGQKRKACPYFAARDLALFADIIFCPYNYLLDPIIRNSIKLSLQGHIVLIDEGHNVEDICRDSASLNLEHSQIEAALLDLETILYPKASKSNSYISYDDEAKFLYFKKYFSNWNDWFQNHKPLLRNQSNFESSYLMSGAFLTDSLRRHTIGFDTFEEFKSNVSQVLQDSQDVRKEDLNKIHMSGATNVLLETICVIFDYLFRNMCGNLDDYTGVLINKKTWSYIAPSQTSWLGKNIRKEREATDKMTLKVSCMNSAIVFDGISKKSRCVILASGTLTPIHSFPAELGTTFPITLHTPHVISPSQVWVGSVSNGPNGIPLEATFRNTSQEEWQDSLGQLILWICQNVPHGVLCFLSSYRLVEVLQDRWQKTGVWNDIEGEKTIFTESKNMAEHNQIMTDYYSCVGEGGAILFAVFRGKVSEGMDFRDHQARAVITVGIPYPNMKDDIVDSKKKYNDSHRQDRSLVSGSEWLQIQAFRALNQALGRCIRHKNDWGAVIMVDSRFRNPDYTKHISKWVLKFLGNQHHDWNNLTAGPNNLIQFMKHMKLTQPDTTKIPAESNEMLCTPDLTYN